MLLGFPKNIAAPVSDPLKTYLLLEDPKVPGGIFKESEHHCRNQL